AIPAGKYQGHGGRQAGTAGWRTNRAERRAGQRSGIGGVAQPDQSDGDELNREMMMVAATQSTLARMAALCTCMALAGCSMMETRSRDDALRDLAWNYEQQGILLNVQADPMLNETNGQPHNLLLLVAQMEDPNAFAAHVREQERLAELLLADRAPDGILDVQRFHVEPGTQRAMHIARVQSARYVGVATGYAQLDPV